MKLRLVAAALLLGVAAPAWAMTVATFLTKAGALKRKGPLAVFSGDLKRLMNQVKGDAAELRKERLAAESAGKRGAFCPPAGGVRMTDKNVLDAMQAVPPAQRARTSTKDALRAYMARRFPCRG